MSSPEFITERCKRQFNTDTKYFRWYMSIIETANQKARAKNHGRYFEAHHILPKSLYPKYKSFKSCTWNMVLLTPREHFIVHVILVKMAKNKKIRRRMTSALSAKNSREYAKIKTAFFLANNASMSISSQSQSRKNPKITKEI